MEGLRLGGVKVTQPSAAGLFRDSSAHSINTYPVGLPYVPGSVLMTSVPSALNKIDTVPALRLLIAQ